MQVTHVEPEPRGTNIFYRVDRQDTTLLQHGTVNTRIPAFADLFSLADYSGIGSSHLFHFFNSLLSYDYIRRGTRSPAAMGSTERFDRSVFEHNVGKTSHQLCCDTAWTSWYRQIDSCLPRCKTIRCACVACRYSFVCLFMFFSQLLLLA
jgi:hypothetical protein